MAKWTLSEYGQLPIDANGNPIPISRGARNSRGFTAAQANVAIGAGTQFCRFCGDTAAHVKLAAGASPSDEYVPAGQDYWFSAQDSSVLSFIVG